MAFADLSTGLTTLQLTLDLVNVRGKLEVSVVLSGLPPELLAEDAAGVIFTPLQSALLRQTNSQQIKVFRVPTLEGEKAGHVAKFFWRKDMGKFIHNAQILVDLVRAGLKLLNLDVEIEQSTFAENYCLLFLKENVVPAAGVPATAPVTASQTQPNSAE